MSNPYLPAVGHATPRDPRWRPRWEKLLNAMSSAGVDVREWPYRAEGTEGKLQAVKWLTLWQVGGEKAVLENLERRWDQDQQPKVVRRSRRRVVDVSRVDEAWQAFVTEKERRPTKAELAAELNCSPKTIDRVLADAKRTWPPSD